MPYRFLLLTLLVMHSSILVLIGRHSRTSVHESELYVVNHLIIVTEVTKFFLACWIEHYTSEGLLIHHLQIHVINRPLDCLKTIVPSLLYLLQNSLFYVALSNLPVPLLQVTYQARLLTTALASVIFLQRSYSMSQWICITALGFGVAIVVTAESGTTNQHNATDGQNNIFIGLVSVLVSCVSSALAGVYMEVILKNDLSSAIALSSEETACVQSPTLWMRNIQMAYFSVCIAVLQGLSLSYESKQTSFFHGFTCWVWMMVVLQAAGGLLVAAVIKYADNVLKGLATAVSVVLSTICSMILFHTQLTLQFIIGAFMIVVSVYFFSNQFPTTLLLSFGYLTSREIPTNTSSDSRHTLETKDTDTEGQEGGDETRISDFENTVDEMRPLAYIPELKSSSNK